MLTLAILSISLSVTIKADWILSNIMLLNLVFGIMGIILMRLYVIPLSFYCFEKVVKFVVDKIKAKFRKN